MADLKPLLQELLDLIVSHVPQNVYSVVHVSSDWDNSGFFIRSRNRKNCKPDKQLIRTLATFHDPQTANRACRTLIELECHHLSLTEELHASEQWKGPHIEQPNLEFDLSGLFEGPEPARVEVQKSTDIDDCESWSIIESIQRACREISFKVVKQKVHGDNLSAKDLQDRRNTCAWDSEKSAFCAYTSYSATSIFKDN